MQSTEVDHVSRLTDFLDFEARGLRAKAKTAVAALIQSLPRLADKIRWTKQHLPTPATNGQARIRHEIYQDIVFPALSAGYVHDDPTCAYWLGKTWRNFIASPRFADQLGEHSAEDFFKTAYACEPQSPIFRLAYLQAKLDRFDYLFHEWPAGILIDHDNLAADIRDLKADIEEALDLDQEGHKAKYLQTLMARTNTYKRGG